MNAIGRVVQVIKFVNKIFYVLAGISLLALFVLMTSDVLGRFLFNHPIVGSSEVALYLIVALAFLGLPYAQSTKSNVTVDILTVHFPDRIRNNLITIGLILSLAFFLLMTWEIAVVGYKDFVNKVVMSRTVVLLPIWVISFLASVGCALLVITLVMQIILKFSGTEEAEEAKQE